MKEVITDTERLDWIEKYGVSVRAREHAATNVVGWWASYTLREAVDEKIVEYRKHKPIPRK